MYYTIIKEPPNEQFWVPIFSLIMLFNPENMDATKKWSPRQLLGSLSTRLRSSEVLEQMSSLFELMSNLLEKISSPSS